MSQKIRSAEYTPKETVSETSIQADTSLYQTKELGRNRIADNCNANEMSENNKEESLQVV